MAGTDSVSVFAEGTFGEQIQELVNYIIRSRPEEERNTLIRPFQEALKKYEGQKTPEEDVEQKQNLFQMVAGQVRGIGDGTDKETEGFFNLLFSHLFSLHEHNGSDTEIYANAFVQQIIDHPTERKFIKYRILSNMFNAVERTSPLRSMIYTSLMQMTTINGDFDTLQITRANVDRWLSEWDIPDFDKAIFYKNISNAYETAGQLEVAYEYERLYIRALDPTAEAAKDAAIHLIATALRLPTILDFDPLFKIDAVLAKKNHGLYQLLQIFLSGGLPEFQAWEESHAEMLTEYNLDRSQLERKIRLLTFATLAFQYVGRDLPYSKVAEAIQVDPENVEKWAIDVIRAGLVWGKLSQATQSLHVTRATARTFEQEQWETLEKRLVAWKSGLSGVLDVIAGAKRQAGLGQPLNVA